MTEIPNYHILQLHGYLSCLSRLCGPGYKFGASSYEANIDIDEFVSQLVDVWSRGDQYLKSKKFTYLKREIIGYTDLSERVGKIIFNGSLKADTFPSANAFEYANKMLIEDINEYYGLASTSLNNDGVFHPLITGPVYELIIDSKWHKKSFYYLVKIENIYVLTYFTLKA